MRQRVLITGIAGFLGSNLCKRLLDEGHDVYGVDDLSAGDSDFISSAFFQQQTVEKRHRGFEVCDFANDWILDQIKEQKFDIVIHLAAMPRVGYSVEYPYETNENNVSKSVKLLTACRDNVKRFINISSSAVYGNAFTVPTSELVVHKPESPYALQKSIMESYCNLFSSLYDMDTVSIRPFNIFGPNQRGSSAYATAVSAWFDAIKKGQPLRSDGTGEQSRDMVYVDNVVDIIVRCINFKQFRGQAFNAGTGTSVSNNEILAWFKKEFPSCTIVNAPAREGDVMRTCADIVKTKVLLGYNPIVNFWDGLELTRKWLSI